MLFKISNKKLIIVSYILSLTIVFAAIHFIYNEAITTENSDGGYLAIIIDDFGNQSAGTKEMLQVEIPYTAAVMPSMPYTRSDIEKAKAAGKEIIIHLPMEPHHGKSSWLPPNSITCNLSNEQVINNFLKAIEEEPEAVGLNNHMGSKVTEDKRIMQEILNIAQIKDLIYVDSKTSPKSVAKKLSHDLAVDYLEREVFLDSTQNTQLIEKQLRKAGDIALKKGYCVAIGHVGAAGGKVTAATLKKLAPELEQKGVKFITVSQLNDKIKQLNTARID